MQNPDNINENLIHVFISSDDNYVQHLCTTITSIINNSKSSFCFHILYDSLSGANIAAIEKTAGNESVKFSRIDKSAFSRFDVKLDHLSLEACFRYAIASIAPDVSKAIYLDCDVIVLGDIKEYHNTDISEHYAAVCEDFVRDSYIKKIGLTRYFNSGVMFLNLDLIRKDGISEKLFKKTEEITGTAKFLDQDALNIVLQRKLKFVPLKWNVTAPVFRKSVHYKGDEHEVRDAIYSPGVIHFTGPDKPWKIPFGLTAHPYTPAYFYYLRKTPFSKKEAEILAEFQPVRRFFWYFKRHLFFFMRPTFFKMRALYKKNKFKYSKHHD